tara:strand:- start:232 stop:345 length:114 start_codon:yes stop_codon:yes gene_type:complete
VLYKKQACVGVPALWQTQQFHPAVSPAVSGQIFLKKF